MVNGTGTGSLSIIDRKKNMFKLSQGEYVAAEKVEIEYAKSGLIAQVWVYGNSFKSFLLAVVVPNADLLATYCRSMGWWQGSADSKLGSDEFSKEFDDTINGPYAAQIKQYIKDQLKQQEKGLKGKNMKSIHTYALIKL
jgi:long-chain acyl-CoA synthetase